MSETVGRCDLFRLESVEGIMEDILIGLPVKTLLRCKAVSKYLNHLISSPQFVNSHLIRSKKNCKYILFPYRDFPFLVEKAFSLDRNLEIKGLDCSLHLPVGHGTYIVCSFHGLLFIKIQLGNDEVNVFVCNPSTRKGMLIPRGSPCEGFPSIAIALDPRHNKYKVFRFFFKVSGSEDDDNYECEVYESETGTWRGLGLADTPQGPILNLSFPMFADQVSVDGRVYWLLWTKEEGDPVSIISVDMEENFSNVSFPEETRITACTALIDLDGHLAMVTMDVEQILEVWVLDNHDESTWDLKALVDLSTIVDGRVYLESLTTAKNEIFLTVEDIDEFIHFAVINVSENTMTTISPDERFWGRSLAPFPFTESLLPCRGL